MRIDNETYTLSIVFDEKESSEPDGMELQLVLQFLPELHADMIRLLNTEEE